MAVGATVGIGGIAGQLGVPSGYLFASMLVGIALALAPPTLRISMPERGFQVGQAVTGVAIGTFLQSSTLSGLGADWIAVILVSAATLAVTIVAGLVLARVARVDRATASLGMVAGGASGIVAMADELGADDRLVAFMQYLRVVIVTLLTSILVPILFSTHSASGVGGEGPILGNVYGWALIVGVGLAGSWIGGRLGMPAPALLGPLILTAVLSVAGALGQAEIPALAREGAFSLIGLRIGLGFDRETLRQIVRLAVPVTVSIGVLLASCVLLGYLLKLTAGVSMLDGYLATTPGGLYAVLPIAYGSGADTAFVLAVQSLRLLAMIVFAPALVRWLLRTRSGGPTPDPAPTG